MVQAPHRMHLVVSSKRSRCSGDWRRSLSGGAPFSMRYGRTERYLEKKPSMSTTRSLRTRNPRIGSNEIGCFTDFTRILQASRFRPLISMASEPQMPCAQERR